jgi:patatin-like phospholipase/acyl hydrolase
MPKYRILAFDGGGIRGVLSITLLRRLTEWFPQLIRSVDLFAGTSIGSIISLALASGLSPEEVDDLLTQDMCRFVFSPRYLGLMRPKYSNKNLKAMLSTVFDPTLRLKELKKTVMIPSFKMSTPVGYWTPVFFNNYPRSVTRNEFVIDVAMASSAAPVYFPSYKGYIDGGVIANNPSLAAIALARDELGGNRFIDNLVLLSIGTGFSPEQVTANTEKWGAIEWMLYPSPLFPLLGVLLGGSVEADVYLSRQLLRNGFYRLNPLLDRSVLLDGCRDISYLRQVGGEHDLTDVVNWLKTYWF